MDNRVKRVSLIIGTAGHVDHGKTSLIKALTSIDTDRLKEEKRRGLTIELGFAYIDFTHKGDSYQKELSGLSKGTPFEDASLFMVSSKTGAGLDTLREALVKFLITKKGEYEGQGVQRYFRMPVDRSFSIKGFGTVVTGTVAGGSVAKGDTFIEYPSGVKAKVRGLQSTHLSLSSVSTGDRSAINISGLSSKEITRGACLMAPELAPFISMSPVVDCIFEFTESMGDAKKPLIAMKNNSLIKVHHLTGEALARIRFVNADKNNPAERVVGRLFLKHLLPMMSGDRFILRDPSVNKTVGGGRVIFSYPYRDLVPRFNRLASCREVEKDENNGDVNFLAGTLPMFFNPSRPGLYLKTLSLLLNLREDNIETFLGDNGVLDNSNFYINAEYLLCSHSVRELKKTMKAMLTAYHEARPLEDGLTPEDLAYPLYEKKGESHKPETWCLYRSRCR